MSTDLKRWSRQTYSLIDFLGDCGGLKDCLVGLGAIFIAPFASFNLRATLLSELFVVRNDKAGGYTNFQKGILGGVERGQKIKHITEKFRHIN